MVLFLLSSRSVFPLHHVVLNCFTELNWVLKCPLARVQVFWCFLSQYHPQQLCLLAAFGSFGLSTREAFRRQCRLERLRSRDMECHSNNQLLLWEEGMSAHPSTYARMVHSLFHWVPLPAQFVYSRKRLKTISARSKHVLVMYLCSRLEPGHVNTRTYIHTYIHTYKFHIL